MGSVSTPVQPFKIEDPAPAAGPTRLIWTVIWMTVLLCPVTASVNPHQPVKITWTLWNGLTREVLNLTTGIHPPNTWWPDLYFNLKDLIKTTWTAAQTRNFGFWACPGHLKRHNWETCGGLQHYFCWSWSCVTSNDGRWKWEVGNRDLVNFSFVQPYRGPWNQDYQNLFGDYVGRQWELHWSPIAQVKVMFNQEAAKLERSWVSGLSWGLQLYAEWFEAKPGGILVISQTIEPILVHSIGPNKVEKLGAVTLSTTTHPTSLTLTKPNKDEALAETDPLWKLVKAAYTTLNQTHPEATRSCWLCYNVAPPYYEAIGLSASYSLVNASDPSQCQWGDRKVGLTMRQVWGKGLCIGTVPSDKTPLCVNVTRSVNGPLASWMIPQMGGWWVCSRTGLTPCVHESIFDPKEEFCVMVAVVPKIIYRSEETVYDYWAHRSTLIQQERAYKIKREPLTAITIATMFGLGIAGAGTGITALSMQSQGFNSLRAAIDEDITRLEQSISHLESSLTSLSEVVLQNRRGLDLLFLQQGGLCAALGEECCFYADHTGIVRESMAKVREGLAQRKREREAQQGWFESWFQQSPWLTTLISTLLGPLIILLIMLTFGPCIINRLVAFVKERINTVQLFVLRQQYQTIPPGTEEDSSV
ncbi:MLV-related proviral Env polyprotein-like [Ovis canadensis]|uniref:MLV-related proviral Env polyprotein-like n=1 Tax=Ovis canadensis TaxID=37174 RepID=UPI0037502E44